MRRRLDGLVRQRSLIVRALGGLLAGSGCGGDDIQGPTRGSIEITTATNGAEPDADGYGISIDEGTEFLIEADGTLSRHDVTPGDHSIRISGIAANCHVEGENPRATTVIAGTAADVAFAITCEAPPPVTGSIQVTTVTTGPDSDPDGYIVSVDGGTAQAIGINATLTISGLQPGSRNLVLSGLAANCRLGESSPRMIGVTAGGTASVGFAVTCSSVGVTRWPPSLCRPHSEMVASGPAELPTCSSPVGTRGLMTTSYSCTMTVSPGILFSPSAA